MINWFASLRIGAAGCSTKSGSRMVVKEGKCRLSVTLTKKDRQSLEGIAAEIDRPVSYVVSMAVSQFLESWRGGSASNDFQLNFFEAQGRCDET